MAYRDYLFQRSNGIFYFRYVLRDHGSNQRREIRLSLHTNKYSLAKRLAGRYHSKLQYLLTGANLRDKTLNEIPGDFGAITHNLDIAGMNPLEAIREIKKAFLIAFSPQSGHATNADAERIEQKFAAFETEIEWVRTHLPDDFENLNMTTAMEAFGRNEPIFRSVKNKEDKRKQDAQELIAKNAIIKKAEAYYGIETDNPPLPVTHEQPSPSRTITEMTQQYCSEQTAGGNWTEKTHCENTASYQLFADLQGNPCLDQITKQHASSYKQQLMCLPTNFNKLPQSRHQSVKSIVAQEHGLKKISITTLNKHLTRLSTFFDWAVNNGYCTKNIASGLTIRQANSAREQRLPFEDEELSQIFSNRIFTHHDFKNSYYFWLPLLAIYTGARINELCQLSISDIKIDNELYFIDINELDDKKLKTPSSKRQIPLHDKLVEIGFLRFVENQKNEGFPKVFNDLNNARDGYATAPSKWFGRFKNKLQLQSPERKAFHSFRHCFVDALESVDTLENITSALIGHKHGSLTYGRYGSKSNIAELKKHIDRLEFNCPELDLIKNF